MNKSRTVTNPRNPAFGLKAAAKIQWEKDQKAKRDAFVKSISKESK